MQTNPIARTCLYLRTLRYVRPIQILSRVRRRVLPARPRVQPAPALRKMVPEGGTAFLGRPESLIDQNCFRFLNEERRLDFPSGWNNSGASLLWLYNLHYFDGLQAAGSPDELKSSFIRQWIAGNKAGQGCGWQPYPTSIRIVNWIKWALSGGSLSAEALENLSTQAEFLQCSLEYHLLGNHLFANAKALVFAGLFFDGGPADKWLRRGLSILRKEIPEQFLGDGGHFELSTSYHALLLEDLLDLINISRRSGVDISLELDKVAGQATEWLGVMTRPDGLCPLFNDAAYGQSPSTAALVGYGSRLGLASADQPRPGLRLLQESGYFRFQGDNYVLIGDVGPIGPDYLPGHAHCDMLSFELFAGGRAVIVDTGTSTYEHGARRQIERGTAAHNTVQIGDHEQSEIWRAFRVGRRARIIERNVTNNGIVAAHDGFLPLGIIHRRRFDLSNQRCVVTDEVSREDGSQPKATASLHFHPELDVTRDVDGLVVGGQRIGFEDATKLTVADYLYAPEFGRLVPGKVARVQFMTSLKTIIEL